MVSFTSAAVLFLAAAAPAFASETLITNYRPGTEVVDHARIDLDQKLIEAQFEKDTNDGFLAAKRLYMEGAHSKSFAILQLVNALDADLQADTPVSGLSPSGQINGDVMEKASAGSMEVKIQYALSNQGCYVGGSPSPVLDGCFNDQGALTYNSGNSLSYTYDPRENNKNGRTIQGFSTGAESKMKGWETYQKFFEYYGEYDYANQWVTAAFAGEQTSFSNGNADFEIYTPVGKEEVIKKGTAYMNVWMYVIHEMEDAIADCETGCPEDKCNDDAVHAWDEAVAFYSGSLEGTDGNGDGVLIHGLADKRCGDFNTCESGGRSEVNQMVISKFTAGKALLLEKKCGDADVVSKEIQKLMAVPLVQGATRYAYIVGETSGGDEKAKAEGAVFAASVLPLVHACNANDAETIYNNLRVGATATDFAEVKKAFENNYDCMGITCDQVGGLYDTGNGEFFAGAEPCGVSNGGGNTGDNTSSTGSGTIVTSAVASFVVAGIAVFML